MAEYVYPFIKGNVFVLNSMYDSWQTQCVLTAVPVPAGSSANGLCGQAAGWGACAGDPTKCSGDQIQHGYLPFGYYFTESLAFVNKAKSSAAGNGGFITSCHTHCEAQGGGFDTFMIGNTTMLAAVTNWMAANAAGSGGAPAADHTFVDCYYTVTGAHVCNAHC